MKLVNESIWLESSPEIRLIAQMEAMMTFKKQESGDAKNNRIHAYPEVLKEKQDLFNFGMIYGRTLAELELGVQTIPKDFERHFEHVEKNKKDQ